METVVDTHAHLTDSRLAPEVTEVVARASAAGVGWIVTVATHVDDIERAIDVAREHANVYSTAGIHPHQADGASREALARVRELADSPHVVAIGETGLDFYYDNADRDAQRESFRHHLELGAELDLPVIVHARDADEAVSRILREVGWTKGVLHCFTGGRALLDEALELGWHISFGGMITFKRWDAADLLRAVPLDRLLVETDSPYLAPVPHRGKRNEPAFVRLVAERAAELRGEEFAALARATTANASTFFGVFA